MIELATPRASIPLILRNLASGLTFNPEYNMIFNTL